jgi:cytochrome b561
MKLKESNSEGHADVETKSRHVSPAFSPSVIIWSLHWASALLVVFLLATSLTSGLGITTRLFPAAWMDWHLSVGILLFAITVVRMKTSHPWNNLTSVFAFKKPDGPAIRSVLLLVVLVVVMSGLAIYQKPPFGRSGILFGSYPMPTLIRLDHSIHNVIIDLHIALSCIIAALIFAHVVAGLRRTPANGRSRLSVMLWPWRMDQKL